MTYIIIHTPDTLIQKTIAKATLKRENSVIAKLANEADKFYGKGQWEQVTNYDNSLDNVIGWYARNINGNDTLEIKPSF